MEECESMEKKKMNEMHAGDRLELLGSANPSNIYVNMGKGGGEVDPYASELPDIDAEEDLKAIRNKDQEIVPTL